MSEEAHRRPVVGEPSGSSKRQIWWIWILAAIFPVVMMAGALAVDCHPIPALDSIPYVVATACGPLFALWGFFHIRKSNYLVIRRSGKEIVISPLRAAFEALLKGVFVFWGGLLLGLMLIGTAVRVTSHERNEYVAQIIAVTGGSKNCKHGDMQFVDAASNMAIYACADSIGSRPSLGDLIKVRTMNGPLGVRFISATQEKVYPDGVKLLLQP